MVILCNWGEKVLQDLIQAGIGSNYQTKRYVGCGQVIIEIVYHALGMTDHLLEVPDKEKVYWWEEIEERREATQRETPGKHKVVAGDISFSDEEEQVPLFAEPVPNLALAPQTKTKIKTKVKVGAPEKNVPSKYEKDEDQ